MSDIVKQLREPPFGTETSERNLMARAADEIDRLRVALELTMVGGNHLASVLVGNLGPGFALRYPPDTDHEMALRGICATDNYEIWCCWSAIMRAREALQQ